MPLPYDPTRDDVYVPMDTSRSAPSLGEHQHAATSTAAAPVGLGPISPIDIQEDYSATDTETSDESDNSTTGSPHEPSAPWDSATGRDQDYFLAFRESIMKEQSKLIRKWATRSSKQLATILEDNLEAHLDDFVQYKAQRFAQVDREVETYRQQRMQDAENASNTYYNNECHDMDEELQSIYEKKCTQLEDEVEGVRKKKMNRMEDNVEARAQRYWETERIRVTREMDEYEKSQADDIKEQYNTACEKLRKQEEGAYSDLKKNLKEEKRKLNADMNVKFNAWKDRRMAAINADVASERAKRVPQIEESAEIATFGDEGPLGSSQGATGSEQGSDNGNLLSLDTVSKDDKTLIVDQAENGPETIKNRSGDMEKGRSVTPNKSRTPKRSGAGTKRARGNEEEPTASKSDSLIESQSVSINQKHDSSDGSTRPGKRMRRHSSSPSSVSRPSKQEDTPQSGSKEEHAVRPSFVVDTKPSGDCSPEIVPTYHRTTDAVLGAMAVVPKAIPSIQEWSCNLEAPELEDSSAPRGIRFFAASQAVDGAASSTENTAARSTGTVVASSGTTAASPAATAAAISSGDTAASSTGIAAANSSGIVMSTSKNYQFGQYQTLVDPTIMSRALANAFPSSRLGTTQERIVSQTAAAANEDEDEDDEL